MEEKQEKEEFKGKMGIVWLTGILVIILGCLTVYTIKLVNENKRIKEALAPAPMQQPQVNVTTPKTDKEETAETENLKEDKNINETTNKNESTASQGNKNNETKKEQTYTNNLIDAENGKTAFLELVNKNELQTEKHNGYYTYVDPFDNKYNIKEIKNVVSEKGLMGNDNWAVLFKVTVTYTDNNNKTKKMELAIILQPSHEIQNGGTYDDFTGTTSFVKGFTDLYGEN